MRPLIFGSSSFTACRIPSSLIHGCWIDCLFSPMNDKAALGHRLRGTATAAFHLYARCFSRPASPPGNLLFALFIGRSSAFQYGKSNSHSNTTIGVGIQREPVLSSLFIHFVWSDKGHEIQKLCNWRVLLPAAWKAGEVTRSARQAVRGGRTKEREKSWHACKWKATAAK